MTSTFWASSCCMLLTCLSGLSASSSAMTLQPSAFACSVNPFCHQPSDSFAAIGLWKPNVHCVPACFAGTLYSLGSVDSTPVYPAGIGYAFENAAVTPSESAAAENSRSVAQLDRVLTAPPCRLMTPICGSDHLFDQVSRLGCDRCSAQPHRLGRVDLVCLRVDGDAVCSTRRGDGDRPVAHLFGDTLGRPKPRIAVAAASARDLSVR